MLCAYCSRGRSYWGAADYTAVSIQPQILTDRSAPSRGAPVPPRRSPPAPRAAPPAGETAARPPGKTSIVSIAIARLRSAYPRRRTKKNRFKLGRYLRFRPVGLEAPWSRGGLRAIVRRALRYEKHFGRHSAGASTTTANQNSKSHDRTRNQVRLKHHPVQIEAAPDFPSLISTRRPRR